MDVLGAAGVAIDTEQLLAMRYLATERQVRGTTATALPGGFISKRRGRGLETADIRIFADGDEIRHIDRNATARTGVPHVRTFQDERDRTTLLLADFNPSMHWGTRRALRSVAAAEALTLIGWRAIASGGRVGLVAFGGPSPVFVPARGRERGMIAVIGGLAAAHRASLQAAADGRTVSEPIDRELDRVNEIAPRGASIRLASSLDDPGDGFDAAVSALSYRADLTVLLVRDTFELAPADGAYPVQAEDGRQGVLRVSGTPSAAPDPAARLLARLGIATHPVDASLEPAELAKRLERLDV